MSVGEQLRETFSRGTELVKSNSLKAREFMSKMKAQSHMHPPLASVTAPLANLLARVKTHFDASTSGGKGSSSLKVMLHASIYIFHSAPGLPGIRSGSIPATEGRVRVGHPELHKQVMPRWLVIAARSFAHYATSGLYVPLVDLLFHVAQRRWMMGKGREGDG